jgi:hypothetical protein
MRSVRRNLLLVINYFNWKAPLHVFTWAVPALGNRFCGRKLERVTSGTGNRHKVVCTCCFFSVCYCCLWIIRVACVYIYTFSVAQSACCMAATVNGLPFLSASFATQCGAIIAFIIKKWTPPPPQNTWVSFEVLKICDLKRLVKWDELFMLCTAWLEAYF